jgi:hypothetical protein
MDQELNIRTGHKNPDFIKETGLYIPDSNGLTTLLPIIHHVDTFKKSHHLYRIQGYMYVAEFLRLKIHSPPIELQKANCEVGLKDDRPIIMIWSMLITDDYPF